MWTSNSISESVLLHCSQSDVEDKISRARVWTQVGSIIFKHDSIRNINAYTSIYIHKHMCMHIYEKIKYYQRIRDTQREKHMIVLVCSYIMPNSLISYLVLTFEFRLIDMHLGRIPATQVVLLKFRLCTVCELFLTQPLIAMAISQECAQDEVSSVVPTSISSRGVNDMFSVSSNYHMQIMRQIKVYMFSAFGRSLVWC